MISNLKYILLFTLAIGIVSCKKPYLPHVSNSSTSYLVVEGIINSGTDSTIIKLSKTVSLSKDTTANPLSNATVTVESNQNSTYSLTESSPGKYVSPGLNLNNSQQYRLRITTADNKVYVSDFVSVLNAPPIDTITYTTPNDGIHIYSATHDPTNTVKYYRWDFQETWMIHSNFFSYFKSNGDTVLSRDLNNDDIYTCWQSDTSSIILLGSSAKLAQNIIISNPITFIGSTSEKLGDRYSILLRQYALTADAYSFYINVKKNTENLGSIFDAQPSEIPGNIHCVSNPSEPVIGYISVGAFSSKRIFIDNRTLPAWVATKAFPNCQLGAYLYKYVNPNNSDPPINQVNEFINYNKGAGSNSLIPVAAIIPRGTTTIIGYTAGERECVDCTVRGTNKQPVFWK